MEEKQFFEYETESGKEIKNSKMHFRNMAGVGSLVGFPFELVEANGLYDHPYDIYSDPETGSYLWAIGGDAHCHTEEKVAIYKGEITLLREQENKRQFVKRKTGENEAQSTETKLAVYKDGIVLYCKPEDKEGLIEKISRVA